MLACQPAPAQTPHPSSQPDMPMTAAGRQQLIDSLSREVDRRYVFPDTASKVAALLRERQGRGAYDGITSARQLAETLTQEMQAASGDRHMRVVYSAAPLPARKPDAEPSAEDAARRLSMMRSANFGVRKIEHLPFNIGYLELDGFWRARDAAETIAAAMTVLAHTDALIIDLRNNGGGDAAASTLLASYLLDKRTHLGDFYYREGNRREQRWSMDVVPGLRYGGTKDVYLLTSKDSFSAAEDFAYALKNLKRASVVGETTGGGANAGEDVRLLPHFTAFMPLSRLISPITQSNWEGVGIKPDIGVCAADALKAAQLAILEKWAMLEEHRARREELRSRIAELGTAKPHCTS
jgi:hypothetical protein